MPTGPAPSFAPVPALRPGARIAVVAPCSPFDAGAFEAGVKLLRERYEVRHAGGLMARSGYLAGDDRRRLAELLDAVGDPEVGAIVAARGGYGATRLLEALRPAALRASPKLLVGFSDVTALHAAWGRAGLRSLHAPMVTALGRQGTDGLDRWVAAAEGRATPPFEGLTPMTTGRAEGPLVGGNLAVLTSLLGTPWEPRVDGAVLLLEEVGERPYRIDRMLTSLRLAGWMQRAAAIVLGGFVRCAPGADGVTVAQVLEERLGSLPLPVVAGAPVGHLDENHPMALGSPTRVDAGAGTVWVRQAATR